MIQAEFFSLWFKSLQNRGEKKEEEECVFVCGNVFMFLCVNGLVCKCGRMCTWKAEISIGCHVSGTLHFVETGVS